MVCKLWAMEPWRPKECFTEAATVRGKNRTITNQTNNSESTSSALPDQISYLNSLWWFIWDPFEKKKKWGGFIWCCLHVKNLHLAPSTSSCDRKQSQGLEPWRVLEAHSVWWQGWGRGTRGGGGKQLGGGELPATSACKPLQSSSRLWPQVRRPEFRVLYLTQPQVSQR